MNMLKVGFSKTNINPPLGIAVEGYYIPRFATGILDDLEIKTLALSVGEKNVLLISIPTCSISKEIAEKYSQNIEKVTGVDKNDIFMSATHTHTGGAVFLTGAFEADEKVVDQYADFVCDRITDSAVLALEDLKSAKMGYIAGNAPERVAYIRRYKMKDGSTMTCPPINDPNIDQPIGVLDQRVNVLRFDRKNEKSIVLVNYGLHADTINGDKISSDWPHWMYLTLDKALDGVEAMFFNGAEGDVGSTNVHPSGGDMNDTEISFDNEMKSYGMARFVGRAIAGTVLQVYDKVCYVDVDKLVTLKIDIPVPANIPDKKDMATAHKYKELHESGRDDLIPYEAMELTTVVAEALRMCNLEHGPNEFLLPIMGVRIGEVALVGIPGEPFTDVGVGIKETDGYSMIMPCALTNGDEGYFPMKTAFDEGGYEARTSLYKSGVAEKIIEGGRTVLKGLLVK